MVCSFLLVGCSERENFLDQECNSWETCKIEESQIAEASEENSSEVILWKNSDFLLLYD